MAGTTSAVWGTGQWGAFNWGAVDRALTGTATAVSSVSATIFVPNPQFLAGTVTAGSTATGTLRANSQIDAAVIAVSITVVGDPTVAEQLTGACHAFSDVSGEPSVTMLITGSSVGSSSTLTAVNGLAAFGRVFLGSGGAGRNGHGGRVRVGHGAAVRTGSVYR